MPSDRIPITARRYNTIFDRAHPSLPWADRTPVSAHVLRHTAINAVARFAGYPVAQTFAGHTPRHLAAPPATPGNRRCQRA